MCILSTTCSTLHYQVEALMKYAVEEHGQIDYLVNNGGGQFMSPVADITAKGWHAVIDTNLTGTFYCLKHGEETKMTSIYV